MASYQSDPRRGPAHRRQHRQAAGDAKQAVRHQKLPAAFSGPARGLRRRRAIRRGNPMDQRIESFLGGRGPGGGAGRPRQVRGDLPAAGAGRRDCPSIQLRRRSYYLSDLSVA
jgi:hypothetical protein